MSPLEESRAYYLEIGRRHEQEIMDLFRDLGGEQEFVYVEAVAHRFSRRQPRPAPFNHLRRGVLYLFAELACRGELEVRQDPGTDFVTRRSFRVRGAQEGQPRLPALGYRRQRLSPLAARSRSSLSMA